MASDATTRQSVRVLGEDGLAVNEVFGAVAQVQRLLDELGQRLRSRSDFTSVQGAVRFGEGPSIDFCTDAELTSGEALSWGLWLGIRDSSWIVESELRRNHVEGQDLVRQLPTRFAATPNELAAELQGAARMLVSVWSEDEPMFPGQGYG